MRVDTIVLAGGTGRRLGGVSKPEVVVAGRTMLDRVLDAVPGPERDGGRVVVVGPPHLAQSTVPTVQEDPPLGGPVAGIDAGLAYLGAAGERPVLVLACDAPLAGDAVPALLTALATAPGADGAILRDREGRRQPLLAVYRRTSLCAALDRRRAAGGVAGASMRSLLEGLDLVEVDDPGDAGLDGDTWQAVADLEAAITRRSG
jgi:molybdopterin-guanine dinucleotide biosynthesis protein A